MGGLHIVLDESASGVGNKICIQHAVQRWAVQVVTTD